MKYTGDRKVATTKNYVGEVADSTKNWRDKAFATNIIHN